MEGTRVTTMADTMTLEPTAKEAAELQAEITYYLTEMRHLNELMAQDQKRIDTLKVETRVIAVETRLLMESLQGSLQELSAA
jgi:hypothetical protein